MARNRKAISPEWACLTLPDRGSRTGQPVVRRSQINRASVRASALRASSASHALSGFPPVVTVPSVQTNSTGTPSPDGNLSGPGWSLASSTGKASWKRAFTKASTPGTLR